MIEFTIPAVPVSANVYARNRRTRITAARDWRAYVLAYGPRGFVPPAHALVTLTFYTRGGKGDADNRAKLVLDALKGRYIIDDGWPHLAELTLRSRPGALRTEVRIEEAL